MAYSRNFIQLRFGGVFGSTSSSVADKWSVGLKVANPGVDLVYDVTKITNLVQTATTLMASFHNGGGALSGTNCFLLWGTGALIGTNGKYNPTTQSTIFYTLATPVAGDGTPVHPWNTALVVSLRTARPRGPASNGRVYYPALSAAITAGTGRMNPSTVANRLTGFKTVITGINTAAGTYAAGTQVCVLSDVGIGQTSAVTALRSDLRIDTQERRENDQGADYQSVTIP